MQRRAFWFTVFLFLVAGIVPAGETPAKARSLAVFKNGLGFMIRTADLVLKDGWGEIAFVPKATLGSFWLFSSSPKSYVEIGRAGVRKAQTERECQGLAELLQINAGAKVRLLLSGLTAAIEGELLSMSEKPEGAERTLPLIHVRTRGDSVMTLPLEQVRAIEWLGSYKRRISEERSDKILEVKVTGGAASESVGMAYLTRSVSWLPGYWLDIRDSDQARLILKATLLNDLEDIQDLDVDFVVGYPNFVFSRVLSPMSLEEDVDSFISTITRHTADAGAFANVTTQALRVTGNPADFIAESVLEIGGDVGSPGQATEDLFFFSQKHVTLRQGERAEYTIFSGLVPYEHIFECSLNDMSGIDEWGNRRGQGDLDRGAKPPVWHCLRLSNTTQYPWTTGPAWVMKGNSPLAQNQLNYIAQGASGLLRLTAAPDISALQGEKETGRRDDITINRNTYTEVQVAGTISLKNHKKETVKMAVDKTVTGAVLLASDAAKTSRLTDEIRGINPRTQIRWQIALAPGESKKLTYQYKVYID